MKSGCAWSKFPRLPMLLQERRLCAAERYLPAQYLAIKAEVLAIQEDKGSVKPEDVTALPFKVLLQGTHAFIIV